MASELTCFKAYDVRGRIPDQLNEEIAYRIGRGYASLIKPRRVVVGHDIRLSSPAISTAVIDGLRDSGVDVLEIGECGTEEIYFATSHFKLDGGIVITASHNPRDYNGLKFVRENSKPISGDTGLGEIKRYAEKGEFAAPASRGTLAPLDHREAYIDHLLGYVDATRCAPLKIVVNAGNGGAGAVLDLLAEKLPFEFIRLQHEADGNFPNGVPNPLLPENRVVTRDAVRAHNADLGVAWDGDFDRCFLFDASGAFIEGYYIVGLLAEAFLERQRGATVIHDPRLTWNTVDIVERLGGRAVQSKTGHAFIKERMRAEDALYGGEMSAHHYFRDFAYCDSGMIPWLLIAEMISVKGSGLAELVAERQALFPASGEINRRIEDPAALLAEIRQRYTMGALNIDMTDGLGIDFADWRFNVRMSNTEPVVRLNVESRGDQQLMVSKTEELLTLMGGEEA